jgi:hypothetical protein
LNSYVENIMRAWCGHPKIPKYIESTYELVQTSAHSLLKFKCKNGSVGCSFGRHNEQAPLGPIILTASSEVADKSRTGSQPIPSKLTDIIGEQATPTDPSK